MTVLQAPRWDLPLIDPQSGRMSRDWYKYLAQLGSATNFSPTLSDDLQSAQNSDAAAQEALAMTAMKVSRDALGFALMGTDDPKRIDDTGLLAWWPGDTK